MTQRSFLKHDQEDFIWEGGGGTTLIGTETTVMESCIGGERLGSTFENLCGQVRIYSRREVCSLLDLTLLEGKMGVRERFWLKGPKRILAESSKGHQTSSRGR